MNYLAERRQEEKERRRAEILDAAEAVVGSSGWDELTMDQVARRARLSRALVYVYFKDKVDLMYGICERGLVMLRQRFDEAVARNKTGLDQITAIGRAYIAFSQEFPVYFDIVARCELREVNTTDASANESACQLAGDGVHGLMVAVLEAGVRDGSIRADIGNPMLAATALWGFTHGVIQLAVTKAKLLAHHGVDGRELLNQAMAMAIRAVAAKP
jgi:TetR/AcrR family transcriptional regulator